MKTLRAQGNGGIKEWANEINGILTPIFLTCFSITAFLLPVFIRPAVCWPPKGMPELQTMYIDRKCWDSSEQLMKMNFDDVPSLRDNYTIIHPYRQLPVVLFIQALFFLLPYVLWRSLESCTGMSMSKVKCLAEDYTRLNTQERRNVSRQLASYLNQWLKSDPLFGCTWGTLTVLTVFIKGLLFANSCTQFALYDIFLKGKNEANFGHELFRNLLHGNGTHWTQSSRFLRTAFCDFTIRQTTNLARYTVQCHLQMNTYYEIICVYVWLWLCFVQLITIASCVYYGLQIVIPIFRTRFVKRHLLASLNLPVQPTDDDIWRFVGSTLGQDGVTVLHWISRVSGDLLVVDTIEHLWVMHHWRYLPATMSLTNPTSSVDQSCHTQTYLAPQLTEPGPQEHIPLQQSYGDES